MIETERTVKPDGSFVETTTQEQSSVVIKRNAKGEFSWELKIYKDSHREFEETAHLFLIDIHKTIERAKEVQL